ncbi:MAG: AAA family ATPase, partial [Clostridiales bacterium]|nr:AAA family ATPase [Clostridiales bacterium]
MLKQITIRNFVLVADVVFTPDTGLNVLSGETGAGKSIVVDAVDFLLGGRADRDVIRTGTDKAVVEGIFDVRGLTTVHDVLSENELEPDENGELLLSREISQSGRGVCRIMGVAVPLTMLKRMVRYLRDIHGQHDHQALLAENTDLTFLDAFGPDEHAKQLAALSQAYTSYKEADAAFHTMHA